MKTFSSNLCFIRITHKYIIYYTINQAPLGIITLLKKTAKVPHSKRRKVPPPKIRTRKELKVVVWIGACKR